MEISLTSECANFVAEQVAKGKYTSESSIINEALQLLKTQNEKEIALKKAVSEGYEEYLAGKAEEVDTEGLMEEIIRKKQQR